MSSGPSSATRSTKGKSEELTITANEAEDIVQRAVTAAVKEVQKLFNEKLEELQTRLKTVESKINEFDDRILNLESHSAEHQGDEKGPKLTTSQLKKDLSDELEAIRVETRESLLRSNDNEQYSRRNNLRINGLQPTIDCRGQVVDFLKSVLHVSDIEKPDIEAAHSAYGSQNTQDSATTALQSRRPAILVRFLRREHRDLVIRARKNLKGTKFAITEDLTTLNIKTMNRLKNSDIVQNTWSWNGKIFAILVNGKKVVVRPFQPTHELMQ